MGIDVDRLTAALAERYRIEREVGRGGMAVVYLARDLKHDRPVAIKVLLPEVAASVGSERFLREIEIAARLNHPHILTLIDSGKADGFLYYVMTYVEDETLRQRLDREGQLPVDMALQIAREVADALSYAHGQDLIHRDIKPGNILLPGGHAVLSDFGIARAVSEAGGERVTRTGVAVGSPVYMSPEQAAGEEHVDARSDVYSLGCVLYEMLAGEPPFTGRTPAAIMARKSVGAAPSLGAMRSTAPPHVQAAVEKALARSPADRFHDASAFADALSAGGGAKVRQPHRRRASGLLLAGIAAAIAVAATAWVVLDDPASPLAVESNAVAIFPFRVTAPDTALNWLAEGMVDMLAPAFDGVSGPRSADPATVVREWRHLRSDESGSVPAEDLRMAAERLGYGLVLTGSVLGTGSSVRLAADLRRVSDSLLIARVDTSGSADPDSVVHMADELAIRLVSVFGGQPVDRAQGLMGTSAEARRRYLEGQRLLRQGYWDEAVLAFELALRRDSTFALAALGLNSALIWAQNQAGIDNEEALSIAWANRDRLPPVDRLIVEARGGAAGLWLSKQSDELAAWKRLVELAPDRADAWFGLADDLFHYGALLGEDRPIERAWTAFVRSYEADSTFAGWHPQRSAEMLNHIVDIALLRRDTAALNRFLPVYLQIEGPVGKYAHELFAVTLLGDEARHDSLLRQMDSDSVRSELWILPAEAGEFGFALEDADRAARLLADDEDNYGTLWQYSLSRGRPAAALRFGRGGPDHFLIRDALYGDGDSSAAGEAAGRISVAVDSGPPESGRFVFWSNLCALMQWRLADGDVRSVEDGIASLRSVAEPTDHPRAVAQAYACAEVLETWLAVEQDDPNALDMLEDLDNKLRNTTRLYGGRAEALNFATARLWERLGHSERALLAVKRRHVALFHAYHAAMLREEGRLAALVGDREGAIDAYIKYLELRSDPEPVLLDEVAAVRNELAQLRSDPPGG